MIELYLCLYLSTFLDLSLAQVHYNKILENLPDDYEATLGILQNNFTDELIIAVLSCNSLREANKIMLEALVEKVNSIEDLLELCEQLEKINGSSNLLDALIQIKQGVGFVQMYVDMRLLYP